MKMIIPVYIASLQKWRMHFCSFTVLKCVDIDYNVKQFSTLQAALSLSPLSREGDTHRFLQANAQIVYSACFKYECILAKCTQGSIIKRVQFALSSDQSRMKREVFILNRNV